MNVDKEHIREFERNNVVVIDNVLSMSDLRFTRDNIQSLSRHMDVSSNDDSVRQDMILSIRESDTDDHGGEHCDSLIHCIKLLRGIPYLLGRFSYSVSHSYKVPQQCQLARYRPDGSIYVRHLDRCTSTIDEMGLLGWLRASDQRCRVVTAILYLNDPDWNGGGELRLFNGKDDGTGANDDNNTSKANETTGSTAKAVGSTETSCGCSSAQHYSDIIPSGGRLILFDSSKVEHQVLASHKEARFALTCWFNGELS
jgi:hypothetical protein